MNIATSPELMVGKPDDSRLVLSIAEVANCLGVSDDLVYEFVHQRRLPCLRLGRRLVIPVRAVDAIIDECLAGFDPEVPLSALQARRRREP